MARSDRRAGRRRPSRPDGVPSRPRGRAGSSRRGGSRAADGDPECRRGRPVPGDHPPASPPRDPGRKLRACRCARGRPGVLVGPPLPRAHRCVRGGGAREVLDRRRDPLPYRSVPAALLLRVRPPRVPGPAGGVHRATSAHARGGDDPGSPEASILDRGGGGAEAIPLTIDQVLAFRAARQHLVQRAPRRRLVAVVRDLVGVQAQVPSAASLSLWARVEGISPETIRQALQRRKTIGRFWCLRGTTHLVARRDHRLLVDALGPEVGGLYRVLRRHGLSDARFREWAAAVRTALASGPSSREQVREILATWFPESREFIGSWGGILRLLAQEGAILFGPTRGNESTFVRTDQWWPAGSTGRREADPVAALLRRYLRTFGPASLSDFAYWSGLTVAAGRRAVAHLDREVTEVRVGTNRLLLLERDRSALESAEPTGALRLLPNFDVTLMGHRDKDLYLDRTRYKEVFRQAGWVSPVILLDGRVIGIWSHRLAGKALRVRLEPFASLPRGGRGRLRGEGEALARFLGAERAVVDRS
ncbi:MAG: hypothetical protein GF346_09520 [Candidatus Eisenbacteria bacterium]|nr:hypothetical protein [Candidatus Latescibacterota bacterium]MBD3302671.1 hypothetical protein [Candidatus Eisenbacteria bacterium]